MQHFYDKGTEHCDTWVMADCNDKGMEQCDERCHGAL